MFPGEAEAYRRGCDPVSLSSTFPVKTLQRRFTGNIVSITSSRIKWIIVSKPTCEAAWSHKSFTVYDRVHLRQKKTFVRCPRRNRLCRLCHGQPWNHVLGGESKGSGWDIGNIINIYAFGRCVYLRCLTVYFVYACCLWIEPMTFALLIQCFTS